MAEDKCEPGICGGDGEDWQWSSSKSIAISSPGDGKSVEREETWLRSSDLS